MLPASRTFWVPMFLFFIAGGATLGCATFSKPTRQTIVLQGTNQGAEFNASLGAGVWLDDQLIPVDSLGFDSSKCSAELFPVCTAYYNKNPMRMGVGVTTIKIGKSLWSPEYIITIRKAGYKDQKLVLRREVDDLYWINVYNLFGFLVDFATGAMWDYGPKTAQLQFIPGKGSVTIKAPH